jgi:hypothetical protein
MLGIYVYAYAVQTNERVSEKDGGWQPWRLPDK